MIWWCAEHNSKLWEEGICETASAQLMEFNPTECRMVEALLIVKENGEWPKWVEECGAYVRWENKSSSWAVRTVGEVLDFLVIAQEALASTQEQP